MTGRQRHSLAHQHVGWPRYTIGLAYLGNSLSRLEAVLIRTQDS